MNDKVGNDDAENRTGYADGLAMLALTESLPASHYTG